MPSSYIQVRMAIDWTPANNALAADAKGKKAKAEAAAKAAAAGKKKVSTGASSSPFSFFGKK